MNGGRVGEVVLHVGGNAVASEGVLRHVHPLGDVTSKGRPLGMFFLILLELIGHVRVRNTSQSRAVFVT